MLVALLSNTDFTAKPIVASPMMEVPRAVLETRIPKAG